MVLIADLPLAERFAYVVEGLRKVLWWAGGWRLFAEPVWTLAHNRLGRMHRRFAGLVAEWRAGALPAAGVGHSSTRPAPQRGEGERPRAPSPLPWRLGWLIWRKPDVPHLREQVAGWRCHLEGMLEDVELKALVAAAPQAGRILRPVCKMVGLKPPEWLALPKRVRERTSPRPSPQGGEGELIIPRRGLPPKEQAEDAVRRSLASGKPIDVKKLSSVAYGYILHPPRGGTGTPPEIGYARSRRRWPNDHDPTKWD